MMRKKLFTSYRNQRCLKVIYDNDINPVKIAAVYIVFWRKCLTLSFLK